MGYTHYWRFNQNKKTAKQNEAAYQRAVKACQKIIMGYNAELKKVDSKHPDRLAGYSAHTKAYGGIDFNGTADLGHENFLLREHFNQNEDFNFCKTARKPYDVVVVACLIILKFYLKNAVTVSSDGDRIDWTQGLLLAKKFSGLKSLKIPETIEARVRLSIVS